MRRFTPIVAAGLLLLATPAVAFGHYIAGTILHSWTYEPSGTYSYWVVVCDFGFSDGAQEDRIIDAINEWNEINGEMRFSWSNWSDITCDNQLNLFSNVVMVRWAPFGGNLVATAISGPYDSGSIDDCEIQVDNDGMLTSYGAYTWYTGTGSPSGTQIDLESTLVHEFGHCAGLNGSGGDSGHSGHDGSFVMHCRPGLTPDDCSGSSPKGVERDELFAHDKAFYITLYGDTH